MENTIKNKQKFFALYFGQDVLISNRFNAIGTHEVDITLLSWVSEQTALFLKPVSSISDKDIDDSINFLKSLDILDVEVLDKEGLLIGLNDTAILTPLPLVDYLRSKGYLLPFHNLTTEQILEYGWAKLKNL